MKKEEIIIKTRKYGRTNNSIKDAIKKSVKLLLKDKRKMLERSESIAYRKMEEK